MEEITVTIQVENIGVEVTGVKGARCLELTQALEGLLGKISNRLLKDDFYGQIEVNHSTALKHFKGISPKNGKIPDRY